MSLPQHNVKFPVTEPHRLGQDEAYFYLVHEGHECKIRFHDYSEMYQHPGLYEQLFYQRLKCASPDKVGNVLSKVLKENLVEMTELRVLDLGAGNGMFGEQLHSKGVARIIGVDICEEARMACERDRPGVYDAYYVRDFYVVVTQEAEVPGHSPSDARSMPGFLRRAVPVEVRGAIIRRASI